MIEKGYEEGCVLLKNREFKKAEEVFQEILRVSPKHYESLNKMGVIFAEQQKYNKAKEYFIQALDKEPNYAPTIVNMGNLCKEEEDVEGAMWCYRLAIEKDPEYPMAYYNLAVTSKEVGDYKGYMKNLKEYKKMLRRGIHDQKYHTFFSSKRKTGTTIGIVAVFVLAMYLITMQ